MLPNSYEIKASTSSKGYYGIPKELKYCDKMYSYTEEYTLLGSAIINAVAEYTKREFEVYLSHKKGFTILFLDDQIPRLFIVNLERYKLEGNKLILIKEGSNV